MQVKNISAHRLSKKQTIYMKKFISSLIFFSILACSSKSEIPPEILSPYFVSSIPEDGAKDIPSGAKEIKLIFNQQVNVKNISEIKLNGKSIEKASVSINTVTVSVYLESKTNYALFIPKGSIVNSQGASIKDDLRISFTTKDDIAYTGGLITPNPSKESTNVFQFLKEVYGKKTISGTMANVNWNIEEAEWVKTQTGKYPALNCFDFIHHIFSPTSWIDYSNISDVQEWWDNNGLVSAMWHWNVPANNGEYSFYYGNKPEETLFDVRKISDPNSSEYKLMIKDIDIISGYLKLLQEKNIPVIWRPLHEAAGNTNSYPGGRGWFWWGANGPEACIELWKLMFDRMTNHHGLNNLIWVWTLQGNDPDWYPGDEYVDIVGTDIYPEKDIHSSQIIQFNKVKEIVNNQKMIALTECGGIPEPNSMFEKGDTWLWFMPWYREHTRDDKINGANYWRTIMENQHVITREEMPNLK